MDPNNWIDFIKRAIQSPESLAFLIVGMAIGSFFGYHFHRLSNIPPRSPKPHGHGTGEGQDEASVRSGPPDPTLASLWSKIENLLAARGIDRRQIERLQNALMTVNKNAYDSDNRLRVMIWSDGTTSMPVAMLWRSPANPRVLIPDGQQRNVNIGSLEDISTLI